MLRTSEEAFKKYHHYLTQEKQYGYYTLLSRIGPLRNYFNYLTKIKKCYLFNPAEVMEFPKNGKPLPYEIPTPNEIREILDGIGTVKRVDIRRKAILELIYSTGIRANELLNLDIYDVNLKENKLMVKDGKGGKDRVVPFGKHAAVALKDYMNRARKYHEEMTGCKKLFLTMWGRPMKYKMLLHVMGGARKGKRLKAHSLRHACAIGMLRNGADIRYIQEILGHSSIRTTQIYTQIMPEHLKEAHAKYHPRGRIKRRKRETPKALNQGSLIPK